MVAIAGYWLASTASERVDEDSEIPTKVRRWSHRASYAAWHDLTPSGVDVSESTRIETLLASAVAGSGWFTGGHDAPPHTVGCDP